MTLHSNNRDPNDPAIQELLNLGLASAKQLSRIGVLRRSDLEKIGAIECFIRLSKLDDFKPSLNFMYALMGALENKPWQHYKGMKGQILLALEDQLDLRRLFD